MALESISQSAEEAICDLLKSLDEACIVSPAMMEQVSIINSGIELYGNCSLVPSEHSEFIITALIQFSATISSILICYRVEITRNYA